VSQYSPFQPWSVGSGYSLALGLSALVCALIGWAALRRRQLPGGPYLALFLACAAWWALTYGLELTTPSLPGKLLWFRIESLGIVSIPVAWLLFARYYMGSVTRIGPRALAALCAIPLATVILTFTNDLHLLVWASASLGPSGRSPGVVVTPGPWYWVNIGYAYLLIAAGSALLLRMVFRYPKAYRGQAALIVMAVIVPWVGNAVSLVTLDHSWVDIAPFSFLLTGIILFLAVTRGRLFSLLPALMPLARIRAVETMTDSVLVLDRDGEVVTANPAALAVFGRGGDGVVGARISTILPGLSWPLGEPGKKGERRFGISVGEAEGRRHFDVVSSPLGSGGGVGSLLVLRDMTERESAMEAVRSSEGRLRSIIEQLGAGFILSGETGKVQEWNAAMTRITGLEPAETLGRSSWDVMEELAPPAPEGDGKFGRARAALMDALVTGESAIFGNTVRAEIVRPDGQTRIVQEISFPVRAEGRLNVGHIIQDITEREAAEAALRESEERLRGIFEQGSIGIAVFDCDHRVVRANPAFAAMLGCDGDEVLGISMQEITAEEDLERSLGEVQSLYDGVRPDFDIDKRYRRKDGSVFWGHVASAVMRDVEGAPVGTMAMVQDVSERKRAEEALETSRAQLEAAMDLAHLVNWELDIRTGLFTFNDRFYALYGTTAEREGGYLVPADTYAERFVHPDERYMVAREIERALQSDDPDFRSYIEHRIIRRDGEIRNLVVRYHIVKDADGRTIGTRGANEDVTEQKRTEQALALAQEQLRQSQKMEAVGQLAGGIAHDFNNLLTAIMGNSDLALDTMAPDDPNRPFVEDIRGAGERAAGLTRQILAFSRRQMLKPEVIRLNDTVEMMEPLLHRTLTEQVEIQTVLAPDLSFVQVDPHQMEQVLMNLAVNGRDAMPDGGRLVIRTANVHLDRAYCSSHPELAPGEYVLLEVRDTGMGMDAETMERIFEPFFTTKEMGKGTGLGLSTVFGIVRQSGGTISVTSEMGKGSAFEVYLPACSGARTSGGGPAPDAEPGRGAETILVVEDERPVRELVVRILKRAGYTTLQAGSATEVDALLMIRGPEVDLLLTDVVLPGGSGGREVAAAIRQRQPEVPVIFMSGYTQDAAVFDGSEGTDADFLAKPFAADALLGAVRAALDARAAARSQMRLESSGT
jgi:two-component system, cell cycle sensor histidine kinase and response regulator CckA